MLTFDMSKHFNAVALVNRIPESYQGREHGSNAARKESLMAQTRFFEEEFIETIEPLLGITQRTAVERLEELKDALGDMLFIAFGYLFKYKEDYMPAGAELVINPEALFVKVTPVTEAVFGPGNLFLDVTETVSTAVNEIRSSLYSLRYDLCRGKVEGTDEQINEIIIQILLVSLELRFDISAILEEICRCNLTKFDTSPEDADETVRKYQAQGVKTEWRICEVDGKHYYVTFVVGDQRLPTKFWPNNKWLKSIHFQEPNHQNF